MKSVILILIIIALLLCGCGTTEVQTTSIESSSTTPEPTPTPTPKFAYSPSYISFSDDTSGKKTLLFSEDGLYAVSMEKTGEKIPDDVKSAAAKKGKEVVNDGRYDVYTTSLFFVSLNGDVKKLDKYRQLEDEKNTDSWKSFKSISDFCGLAEDENHLFSIEKTYVSGSSAPDNAEDWDNEKDYNEFKTNWYIREIDKSNGRIISSKKISNENG